MCEIFLCRTFCWTHRILVNIAGIGRVIDRSLFPLIFSPAKQTTFLGVCVCVRACHKYKTFHTTDKNPALVFRAVNLSGTFKLFEKTQFSSTWETSQQIILASVANISVHHITHDYIWYIRKPRRLLLILQATESLVTWIMEKSKQKKQREEM